MLRTAAAAWVAGVRWGMEELFSSGLNRDEAAIRGSGRLGWQLDRRGEREARLRFAADFFGGAGNTGGGRREVDLRWMVVGSLGKTRRRPGGLAAARWERMDRTARF